jgi:hypothetical protein
MAPWTFSVKFPCDTQFTFGSFMFVVRKDGNLELLTWGPAPECLTQIYGQPPYLPMSSSTSGGARTGLNPYAGLYHHAIVTTQGILIKAPIFQPSARTLSYYSSVVSPDQDSTDDYPEIGESTAGVLPMRVTLSSW